MYDTLSVFRPFGQARTFDDPAERRREVEEFDEDAMLPHLARQWKVPFLSKVRTVLVDRKMET